MTVLAMGTCRTAHTVRMLNKNGDGRAIWLPHSVFTPDQILQTLSLYHTRKGDYHTLMSGEALRRSFKIPDYSARRWIRERKFLSPAQTFEAFIVEISATDNLVLNESGHKIILDRNLLRHWTESAGAIEQLMVEGRIRSITRDDLLKEDSGNARTLRTIPRISRFLRGKPILFVAPFSHGAHSASRAKLAEHVRSAAEKCKADFYNPARMIEAKGKEQVLRPRPDGTLRGNHFNETGYAEQGKVLRAWLDGQPNEWIERFGPTTFSAKAEQTADADQYEIVCEENALEAYAPS